MKRISIAVVLTLAVLVAGCSQESTANAPAETPKASPVAMATSTPSGEQLKVSAEGSKFEPPVAAMKIPNEAWACVMNGTVHYASMDKGTGKCPTCKMKLVQHAAHQEQ